VFVVSNVGFVKFKDPTILSQRLHNNAGVFHCGLSAMAGRVLNLALFPNKSLLNSKSKGNCLFLLFVTT